MPQTALAVTAGNNQAYNLTTWHGTANIKGMPRNEVQRDIIDITLQEGPVDLQPAAFGLTSDCTDGIVLRTAVNKKIIKLAYLTVCKTLFTEFVPLTAISHMRRLISSSKSLSTKMVIRLLRQYMHTIQD